MDPSHGKRRKNEESDRLSSLSDDLIHKILSFTSIKHAIQMSVLSSRWRFIWTSMPYLSFSRDDFLSLSKLSEFVTHVLSDRNNQRDVYSVKLHFDGEDCDVSVKQIMAYALSHNIQQLNVAYLLKKDVEFPPFLFSSRTLKHLSLTRERSSSLPILKCFIKAPSTWELPSLTTLYLHRVTLCCDERIFSKFENLKNLTLKDCDTKGSKVLSICLPILSTLTLVYVRGSVQVFNVVAPQLKNLSIKDAKLRDFQCLISAPDLESLVYDGCYCLQLSAKDFSSLEKADIRIFRPKDAHQVLCLLQRLHNVKSLSLNLEIVELLSSSVELMSNLPSPFANLKSLKIYPLKELTKLEECHTVKLSAEVKRYLLETSPGATFSMVTREDARNMYNTELAQNLIRKLRASLEQEKARTATKIAKMRELGKSRYYVDSYIDLRWKYMSLQIKKVEEKGSDIISKLKEIKELLTELPASNRATVQPSFSTLCAEADTVTSMITDFMKMDHDENQRCFRVCFHKLASS